MARLLEIKGLGNVVADMKRTMQEVRASGRAASEEGGMLKAELDDLKEQLAQHRADLKNEAETLGNG